MLAGSSADGKSEDRAVPRKHHKGQDVLMCIAAHCREQVECESPLACLWLPVLISNDLQVVPHYDCMPSCLATQVLHYSWSACRIGPL